MRASTVGTRHDLGRHEQRADQSHARQRQDVERRDRRRTSHAHRAEVLAVEPSHFDAAEAYAVIDLHRVGDYTPYRLPHARFRQDVDEDHERPRDRISRAEASRASCGTTRMRKGLLFAGTESGMYVSFDDGDHWQSLQLEPAERRRSATSRSRTTTSSSRRTAAASGRSTTISMLRQVDAERRQRGRAPLQAGRRRAPAPQRRRRHAVPARGAARAQPARRRDHRLLAWPRADERHHARRARRRRRGRASPCRALPSRRCPKRRVRRIPISGSRRRAPLPKERREQSHELGSALRRATGDVTHSFEINANPGLTPASPEGALVPPGTYTVKLTVDGKTYAQTVAVKADPRSRATLADLSLQSALLRKVSQAIDAAYDGNHAAASLRDAIRSATNGASPEIAGKAATIIAQLDSVAGGQGGRGRGRGGQGAPPNFASLNGTFVGQLNAQDQGDLAPTAAARAAWTASCMDLAKAVATWQRVSSTDLNSLNAMLTSAGKSTVAPPNAPIKPPIC